MTTDTQSRAAALLGVPSRYYAAGAAILVCVQIAILHGFGQPWIAASGRILLWVGDPRSADNSQQLADWYSFSHIIHGFIFFGVLRWLAPQIPFSARLLMAMAAEIGWEAAENSPAVIQHYRKQALAAGYVGDSILNSVCDTLMMTSGFLIASRLRLRSVIALALGMELFTAWAIRDNLTLNIFNLLAPSDWGLSRAIHDWQSQAPRK
jgi:hypothetical protein